MGRSKKCSDNLYLDDEFDILQGKKFKCLMTNNSSTFTYWFKNKKPGNCLHT